MPEKTHPFVTYLEGLRDAGNRGALAALRRGLGQSPGTVHDMYRYVVPWLGADISRTREAAYFLIAALFAYHPDAGGAGNLGTSFAHARDPQGENSAVERRFTALLSAHTDDLPFYLRQAISFLKSKETPVNWHQLFSDILAWDHPQGYVQKQWARAFWGHAAADVAPSNQSSNQEVN